MKKTGSATHYILSVALNPFTLLLIVLVLWFLGAFLFRFSFGIFAGIFGPINDLQNVFSPVGALFTGIATWGAIYTIYKQVELTARQQFENIFFNLLAIHDKNSRGMLFPTIYLNSMQAEKTRNNGDYIIGKKAFILYYNLLKNIHQYLLYSTKNSPKEGEALPSVIKDDIDDLIRTSFNQEESSLIKPGDIFKTAYDLYHQYTDEYYSNYARHLYHTLKHIDINNHGKITARPYVQILRAQLSIYETALLYYRALWSPDKPSPESHCSKYQLLIEASSFMHLLCDDMAMLFDKGTAGKMNSSAFNCDGKHACHARHPLRNLCVWIKTKFNVC
ncbi:MAG: putative phage abortive infection protein [Solidesulfovibrio sp.]|uniref:putative phage abortive infection protein n=1 Tax=Solidesulfovibrio sp. TaxID=2910990 RepID=UPI002B1EC096|nr:putative phage abortive infection protein [Solidesulfovibrio sp.]MEA4858333.1 putative phage abortive infection protein [Solidesulfovibrio sp.]